MRRIFLTFLGTFLSVFSFSQETYRLSLNQAVEYALENNIDSKKTSIDIRKAREELLETRAIGLPQIKGDIDYNYYIDQPVSVLPFGFDNNGDLISQQSEVTFGTRQDISAGITLTQLLFNGPYIVALKAARTFEETFALNKEKTTAEIKEEIISLYGNTLVANETITIIENNLNAAEKNLFEATEFYKEGLGELQTVERFQLTNNQLQTSLNVATRSAELSNRTLKFILGLKQEDELILITPFESMSDPSFTYTEDENLKWELKENIDYLLALNNMRINELILKREKSFALPSINGFLNYQQQRFSDDFPLFLGGDTNWNPIFLTGIQLDVPIFSSFSRRSKTNKARLDLEKAKLDLENASEGIKLDVARKKSEYVSANENLALAVEARKLANNIYKRESIKYKEGLGRSSDLRIAEADKYNADDSYIKASFQLIDSKNKLLKALGKY